MKNSLFGLVAVLVISAAPARALTNADISGVYRGTSVATLPDGQSVTAAVTVTLKVHGREIVVADVDGQTSTTTGHYQFATDDILTGRFPTSEFTAFVDLNGKDLTLTVLAKEANGEIVSEVTTLKLVQKL